MRVRGRKRSAAITLVLVGSATLAGCGKPIEQRDAYKSQQDCLRDWSNASLCEPVRDGKYSSSYFYGPPYFASNSGSWFGRDRVVGSPNAMETSRLSSGSVARSSTGQLAMRMGAGPSSSVSRGGFGSTGHSSGGSSS
jgi:hypothetical protein